MRQLLADAALLCGVLALVSAAAVLLRTRSVLAALPVLLDLLLAAGLLRLSADTSWQAIATAAAVVGLRRLVAVHGVLAAQRSALA